MSLFAILLAEGVLDGALRGALIGGAIGAVIGLGLYVARKLGGGNDGKKNDDSQGPPDA